MKNLPDITAAPFTALITSSESLMNIRSDYASTSRDQRHKAADFCYSAGIASQLFQNAVPDVTEVGGLSYLIEALAIDPDFAPGLLGIGSIEYQLERPDEAMVV